MKSSPLIWSYVVNVKLTVKILSIFVAFLENMNFTYQFRIASFFSMLWPVRNDANKLKASKSILTFRNTPKPVMNFIKRKRKTGSKQKITY